jgi:endonuclease YncB( thermonuclease family)
MKKVGHVILLIIMVCVLIAFNYNSFDGWVTKNISPETTITVSRVIDGDTVVYKNGDISQSVRMLGINTPEKGEYLYAEATNFTKKNVMNVSLKTESKGKDLYDRELAYAYDGEKNINLEIVREGYASTYFPEGKDVHYNEFAEAWQECLNKNINLCEKSTDKCASCIELKEWDFDGQKVVLYNRCNFDCSLYKWTIKDEGRKKFTFNNYILKSLASVSVIVGNKTNTQDIFYWKDYSYVWTYTGDSIFLRDDKSKLVFWETKGY